VKTIFQDMQPHRFPLAQLFLQQIS